MLRYNMTLEEVKMPGIGATAQSFGMICDALMYNKRIKLKVLDISNNPIEDKGFIQLSKLLFGVQSGISILEIGDCGASKSGCTALFESLDKNAAHSSTLSRVRNGSLRSN